MFLVKEKSPTENVSLGMKIPIRHLLSFQTIDFSIFLEFLWMFNLYLRGKQHFILEEMCPPPLSYEFCYGSKATVTHDSVIGIVYEPALTTE